MLSLWITRLLASGRSFGAEVSLTSSVSRPAHCNCPVVQRLDAAEFAWPRGSSARRGASGVRDDITAVSMDPEIFTPELGAKSVKKHAEPLQVHHLEMSAMSIA